jgi:diguanylate cyclase (GGDEF)-like protein/PAS domain S-box-containing protein
MWFWGGWLDGLRSCRGPARRRPLRVAFGGIKFRLVGMVLLVALPVAAIIATGLIRERARDIEAAHVKAQEIAGRGGEQYRQAIAGMRSLLQTLSLVPEVVSGSPESCAAFLDRAGRQFAWAEQFWVMESGGQVICATLKDAVGRDASERDYFKTTMATREFSISNLMIARVSKPAASVLTLPVLDERGAVTRVLAVSLRLEWFATLFAEVSGHSGASVILFDGQDVMLARYPDRPDWIGKSWRGTPLIERIANTAEGSGEIVGVEGVAKIVGWASVPGTRAHIAVGFDRAQVLDEIDTKMRRGMLVMATLIGGAILAGLALARSVVRPLKLLTQGAEAVRNAPDAALPKISAYAEVASLSASLDALLTDRRRRERALIEAHAAAERAEHQAREAHAYLTNVIEMLPEGIVIFDADEHFHLWNRCFAEQYAFAGELIKGERLEDRLRASVAAGAYPSAVGREEDFIAERLARHALPESSCEQEMPGGRWIRIVDRRMRDGTRIGVRSDITEIKRREESFRLLFESNPVPMWVHERETYRMLAVNDAAVALYGHDRDKFLSMTAADFHMIEYNTEATAPRDGSPRDGSPRERHWRDVKADGSFIEVTSYSRSLDYGGCPARLVAIIDVTERKRAEARISHMTHYDALTGLANLTLFRQCLDAAAARASERGFAALCIDLDDFKGVNDGLGHPAGDRLLRAVASRLTSCLGEGDTLARLGGDEFALIRVGIADEQEAQAFAARLVAALAEPYDIDGRAVAIAASVGIAMAPRDSDDAATLLRYADMALYGAKSDGGHSIKVFDRQMDMRLMARRAMEYDLREALADDALQLWYQPSIDLATGRATGFEALARWNDAKRGHVSPAEFIPVAEEIGLIDRLGEWVIRRACADAAAWPPDVRVAVNLSPLQFKNRDLVRTVLIALASSGLPAHRLELEITESVLLHENESNLAILQQLRGLGVRIAVDDFGIGYSSLSYLRMFPFDRIKIDRSFVIELPTSRECANIIRSMVELAKNLDIAITAEGIETAEQLAHLRADGCTEGQGFLFSPARPVREVADMLDGPGRERLAERAA